MEELYSKHSEKVKYLKPIKINMIDSDLKTSTKSKSIEKNNFLSKKDNICKIYDIKIKNCLKKIDILNTINRPSSAKSSKRKIFFNNKISDFINKIIIILSKMENYQVNLLLMKIYLLIKIILLKLRKVKKKKILKIN